MFERLFYRRSVIFRSLAVSLAAGLIFASFPSASNTSSGVLALSEMNTQAVPPPVRAAFAPPHDRTAAWLHRLPFAALPVPAMGLAALLFHPLSAPPVFLAGFFPLLPNGRSRKMRNAAGWSLVGAGVGLAAVVIPAISDSPREMWTQPWITYPIQTFYRLALDRYVEMEGLENIPDEGPVILAGNHINKYGIDGAFIASKLLRKLNKLPKIVATDTPKIGSLQWVDNLLARKNGMLLLVRQTRVIGSGLHETTQEIVAFLKNPQGRKQPIAIIFPTGEAGDVSYWHKGAAFAALEAEAPIVPFYLEGLPLWWSPLRVVREAAAHLFSSEKPFIFRIRFGKLIQPAGTPEELTEKIRQASHSLRPETTSDQGSGRPGLLAAAA